MKDYTDAQIAKILESDSGYQPEEHMHVICKDNPSQYGCRKCHRMRVPESDFCWQHGGHAVYKARQRVNLRNYRLNNLRFSQDASRLAYGQEAKSLRDELGLLRMLLESELNNVQDSPVELMARSASISDLVLKIERLVKSCQTLEDQQGQMIHISEAILIAQRITETVSKYITDSETLEKVSHEITECFNTSTNGTDGESGFES